MSVSTSKSIIWFFSLRQFLFCAFDFSLRPIENVLFQSNFKIMILIILFYFLIVFDLSTVLGKKQQKKVSIEKICSWKILDRLTKLLLNFCVFCLCVTRKFQQSHVLVCENFYEWRNFSVSKWHVGEQNIYFYILNFEIETKQFCFSYNLMDFVHKIKIITFFQ